MLRRLLSGIAVATCAVALLALVAFVGHAWYSSRLPDTYNVMDYGTHDYGGGSVPISHESHPGGVSVAELTGPGARAPDAHFDLVARTATIRLASGRPVEALTFGGRSPGPELRVTTGDLVEVTLGNENVDSGVTIHWHGVDVPNAEDGVAGVTQDAVRPGERYTYRFRVHQAGTFWYHTHQVSSTEVRRGLFGALVVEPKRGAPGLDLAVVVHTFDGIPTLNPGDVTTRRRVEAGTPVRLRLVNSDSAQQRLIVTGTPFVVLAIDGTDLHGPDEVDNLALAVAAGGRIDVGFTMPSRAVRVEIEGGQAAIVLAPGAGPEPSEARPSGRFDPLSYGEPAPTPFAGSGPFDRRFQLRITRKLAFLDGRPGRQWALNGGVYPDVPMFVVDQGDLVEVAIVNDTDVVHPMHLHGHHLLVLSRDGTPASGSPWWVDTLDVEPGQRYVLAFRADNPGIWMDHCHNLGHAAAGLTMHLAYAGVTTPFLVGGIADNTPE